MNLSVNKEAGSPIDSNILFDIQVHRAFFGTKRISGERDQQNLKDNGAKIGDTLCLIPTVGREKKLCLKRTRYQIVSNSLLTNFKKEDGWILSLETLGNESFALHLDLVDVEEKNKSDENKRYQIYSHDGSYFNINGVLSSKAFICRGDKIQIGFNIIRILDLKQSTYPEDSNHIPQSVYNSKISVLLVGETGTGKSKMAKEIYNKGKYLGPFLHLNLSSLSPQLIESELFGHEKGSFTGAICTKSGALLEANDGILFLDEIDSLPLEIQTKLLLF